MSYASFPVERNVISITTESISETETIVTKTETTALKAAAAKKAGKDKWIGVALWFFLWPVAAHRWYYNKPIGWNILFILTLGGLGIWAIVDLINLLTDNF